MNQNKLYQAIRRIAWGYVLIHVNLNLGTINVLPNWCGYILFLMALEEIKKEEESAELLVPLGKLLLAAELLFWVNDCILQGNLNVYLLGVIVNVIRLYFHFQLLTNLAEIARKYGCREETKILHLRTAQTLLTTFMFVLSSWRTDLDNLTVLLVVAVIVAIWICKVLFSFSKSLNAKLQEQGAREEVMV